LRYRKAQFAVEYLLVISLLFMMLIPGIYMYYSYSQTSMQEVAGAKIADIGNSVINNAENSYFLGQGSRITLDITMPQGVKSAWIKCSADKTYCELVFKFAETDAVFTTDVPIKCALTTCTDGINFDERAYSSGEKKFVIETTATDVLIDVQ
jgi:hypothetical protein